MNKQCAFLLAASWILCWSSCYNQVALSGGPRDEIPPQLDTSKSTDNFQIHFVKQEIVLEFDEYVDLRDANTQIVISPPLKEPPKIANRLKRVQFEFNEDEVLREDVTYVINFGKSIRDFTEGNELLNFTFVFSTGDYIDSLSLQGEVIDAKTRSPKEDALVLLYIDHQDSIVFKERPFYFARTDENGQFQINNLRADTFKVVTIIDQNLNYLYDPATDEIGFLDSLIILSEGQIPVVSLSIFKESTKPRYRSFEIVAQGRIRIDFEGRTSPDAVKVLDSLKHFIEHKEELEYLTLWYHPTNLKGLRYEVFRGNELDTIQARINLRSVDTLENYVAITSTNITDGTIGLHPEEHLEFTFDRPISQVDLNLIQIIDTLTKDTLVIHPDSLLGDFPSMKMTLAHAWPTETDLAFTFFPGAIIDFFGKSIDTTERIYRIAQDVDFGQLVLTPVGFDSGQYVIQLMRKDKLERSVIYVSGDDEPIIFDRLTPDTYQVQIINDKVPNGRWDPGNYLDSRQSEEIYQLTLPELRPNWLLEENIIFSELKADSGQEESVDNEQ